MTTELVSADLQPSPAPSKPKPVYGIGLVGLLFAVVGILLMGLAAIRLRHYNDDNTVSTVVAVLFLLASLYPLVPSALSFVNGGRRASLLSDGQLVPARRAAAAGREDAQTAMGYAVAIMIVAGLLLLAFAHSGGITQTFFQVSAWHKSFTQMLKAFWINIWVSLVSEAVVLVFALLLAIMRTLPGRAGAPLRLIALVYCDVFRAIPAVVTILLIAFGLPLAIPAVAHWHTEWLGVVALSLTYSAYVAEVYRAGLTSIHPSQSAAARSLGLSYGQTLRTVLVPQAVRRVIPPLLNDFISLQKDTALLFTAGTLEVLGQARQFESYYFTLAPVTLAAIFYIIITIPQARFTDWLIERDARRRGQR